MGEEGLQLSYYVASPLKIRGRKRRGEGEEEEIAREAPLYTSILNSLAREYQ